MLQITGHLAIDAFCYLHQTRRFISDVTSKASQERNVSLNVI
jgi:hypothetical protein